MSWIWLGEEHNLNDLVMAVAGRSLGMNVDLEAGSRWVTYARLGQHAFSTYGMRFPIDSPAVIEQANDKIAARRRMAEASVPTLPFYIVDGERPVLPTEDGDWTLKISNGKQGGGVVSRIPTAKIKECAAHLATLSRCLILEPTLHGPTYRFLVLDGEVIDAHSTAPPRLVGDGLQTVHELFHTFIDRMYRGYGIRPRIDFEAFYALAVQGLKASEVVAAGRQFHPTFLSNISRGGTWTCLYGKKGFETHARAAREAAGAVGLRLCGVDLAESRTGELFVLEANPSPGIARFTWMWRSDFKIDCIYLRVPLSILAAVLRATGRLALVADPEFVTVSATEFEHQVKQLLERER